MGTRILLLSLMGAFAATASAQTTTPAASFPSPNSGCGENGLTASQSKPTVRLRSATLRLRSTGRVRILVRGNQTAATTVKISQVRGRRVGGTSPGGYTCVTPSNGVVSLPLDASGRKLVRRNGRLAVRVTFRLINGSGVTHTRSLSAVIKPE